MIINLMKCYGVLGHEKNLFIQCVVKLLALAMGI